MVMQDGSKDYIHAKYDIKNKAQDYGEREV